MILKKTNINKGIYFATFLQCSRYTMLMLCGLLLTSFSFAQTVYIDPLVKITHQAQRGNLAAQVELATAYEHGEGITKNPDKALVWYCKAAIKGSVDAQRNLAWMFLNARGIKKDEALAVRWYKTAARSGDQHSKTMLSRLNKDLRTKRRVCIALPTPYWESRRCSKSCKKIVKIVNDISPGYNIEPRLILALIQQESNFEIKALSNKGAMGLMQLMPQTAKRFGVKNAWTPEQNIRGGIRYIVWLLKQYQGNVALALAGYNAGEKAVARYKGIPPYKETQNYVKRILKLYGKSHHPYGKSITMITK